MEPSKTIEWEKEFDEKYIKRTDLRDGKGVDSYLLIEHKGAFAVPPPKLIKSFIQKLLTKICTEHHHLLLKAEQETRERTIKECIKIVSTHIEGEELGYCDTGADMEFACRSDCVEMAVNRLQALKNVESLKVTKQ